MAVHPALPGWFTELEQAFAHCAWVSDWGSACILFAQGAGLDLAARWPHLEAPMDLTAITPLTWHKLDGVRARRSPGGPGGESWMIFMAPQTGRAAEADYIKQDIIRFAQRPGPTLLVAPAQEIGLTRDPSWTCCANLPATHKPRCLPRVRYTGAIRMSAYAGRTRCRANWKSRYSSTRGTDMKTSDARKHYIADIEAKSGARPRRENQGLPGAQVHAARPPQRCPVCEFDESGWETCWLPPTCIWGTPT